MGNLIAAQNPTEVYKEINRAIRSPLNVILEGESGVGKDYYARLIHQRRNWGGEFVVYDCERTVRDQTWMVEELTSPVFFEKLRRLTKMDTFFIRRMELLPAHLFARLSDFFGELDKSGTLPRNKLLSLGIVGSVEKREINGSPNQVLLYTFLNSLFCFKIEIPPLRERKREIPWFVERFISLANDELRRNVMGINQHVLEVFLRHSWPNNLFELRAEIERAITLTKDYESIKTSALSENLIKSVSKMGSLHESG